MQVTAYLNSIVRTLTLAETQMSSGNCSTRVAGVAPQRHLITLPLPVRFPLLPSVERILAYSEVPGEDADGGDSEKRPPPSDWPQKPNVTMVRQAGAGADPSPRSWQLRALPVPAFVPSPPCIMRTRPAQNAVTLRYRPELPPSLQALTLDIHAGERIGIVRPRLPSALPCPSTLTTTPTALFTPTAHSRTLTSVPPRWFPIRLATRVPARRPWCWRFSGSCRSKRARSSSTASTRRPCPSPASVASLPAVRPGSSKRAGLGSCDC